MSLLWKKDEPIINSLLEVDVYKFNMLYFIWKYFPDLEVKFEFKNRNPTIQLVKRIDVVDFSEELEHVMTLGFREDEIAFLDSWGLYPPEFLDFLKTIKLPEPWYWPDGEGGRDIVVAGKWLDTTLWELYILPIISELNTRYLVEYNDLNEGDLYRAGELVLLEKIDKYLKRLRWKMAHFGLRRRASGLWERRTMEILLDKIPHVISGTSNVKIAMELGIEPIGTNAHELPMALYALRRWESSDVARESVYEVLDKWQYLFQNKLLIMLTDTFGSEPFYDELPLKYLRDWRGSRQDSGDPFEYGEKMIALYKKKGIDPKNKTIFFSDGLNPQKMLDLEARFHGRVGGGFGVGTNLSNDIPGIEPVPMVMKLTEAAGRPAVKLSDNLNKAIGNPDEVQKAKEIFGYSNTFREEIVY